jgi:hypothetical protein
MPTVQPGSIDVAAEEEIEPEKKQNAEKRRSPHKLAR